MLSVQESALHELKAQINHTWLQINDKEEVATRWLSTLIVLGLLQLFPFSGNDRGTSYLILSLPSFVIAFYSVALTLYKHPNYQRTDFFVPEEADKETRYNKNEAEFKGSQKIFQSLIGNYERKKKFSGYIGPAVMTNFSVSILYLITSYVLNIDIQICLAIIVAAVSLIGIYVVKMQGPSSSFSFTYKQDETGNRTVKEE